MNRWPSDQFRVILVHALMVRYRTLDFENGNGNLIDAKSLERTVHTRPKNQ